MRKRGPRRRKRRLEPEPAPGDLRIVQELVNTSETETEGDALADPPALAGWLARQRLLPRGVELAAEDLERTRALRAGLYALMRAHSGAELDSRTVETLDREAAAAPLHVRFTADGTAGLEPRETGFDAACAELVSFVLVAQIEGRWKRCKICARTGCGRAFYDFSKSRTGKWCTETCGDRVNALLTRRRHPGKPGGSKYRVLRAYAER